MHAKRLMNSLLPSSHAYLIRQLFIISKDIIHLVANAWPMRKPFLSQLQRFSAMTLYFFRCLRRANVNPLAYLLTRCIEHKKINYQLIKLLEYRGILRLNTILVNVLKICTRKIMFLISNKLVAPVLANGTLYYLFRQIFHHAVRWR